MAQRPVSVVINQPGPNSRSSTPGAELPSSPADGRGRLKKPIPASLSRPTSSIESSHHPSLQSLRSASAQEGPSPLLPPPVLAAGSYSRSSSLDRFSRPATPLSASRPSTPGLQAPSRSSTPSSPVGNDGRKEKKHGLFSKHRKDGHDNAGPAAWIAGHPQRQPYDVESLLNGRPLDELWDDAEGNCYIHLFPRDSDKGPSFKIDSEVFASSPVLARLAFGQVYSNDAVRDGGDRRDIPLESQAVDLNLTDFSTPPASPPRPYGSDETQTRHLSSMDSAETHLYLPIKLKSDLSGAKGVGITPPRDSHEKGVKDPAMEDMQTLVDVRNFFAFLCGQSLVATERRGSFFHIFLTIAGILKTYEFTNVDGSTYGEIASNSFDNYVEELGLADVRNSRDKTIEGVVLGERMKSILLYNEAFTHAVGKHSELVAMKSPKFAAISSVTQNRLFRAAMDLEKRTASIRLILESFDFPFLFSGIMASKTSEERKEGVRFDAWKESFLGMRKNFLTMLKHKYGDWPPKAKSKKNDLETSGLNRLVLRDLYTDLCSMYDYIVDRNSLTTRTVDGIDLAGEKQEATIRAVRAVLSEYDRSSPPVKPPVPFDLPKMPDLRSSRPDFGSGDKKKDSKTLQKKLRDEDIAQILRHARNEDTPVSPFVETFRDIERRATHNCTISEVVDIRIGQWIFMYVVLQALPMLALDAPALKWTKGVEYFLCEPPRSGVPWANTNVVGGAAIHASAGSRRTWFSVGDGSGVVSLPSDVVENSVEGIYRRSHCWVMAEKWSASNPVLNSALHEHEAMNSSIAATAGGNASAHPMLHADHQALPPPPAAGNLLSPDSRSSSPISARNNRASYIGIGLEALPLPPGVSPDGRSQSPVNAERRRSEHIVDKGKTFDAILAGVQDDKAGKKGKKK